MSSTQMAHNHFPRGPTRFLGPLPRTLTTEPVHGHVREVGPESHLALEERGKRGSQVSRHGFNSVATVAYEMDVSLVFDRVISRWAMIDVSMRHQTDRFEYVDRSIHRGEIDTTCRALNFGEYLIRRGVM